MSDRLITTGAAGPLAFAGESDVRDFVALLKPRVMSLVVFTGAVGLYLAPGHLHPVLAAIAILCIAVGAGAAGAINMWYERDIDAVMTRTRERPIPAGRMDPAEALAFGIVLSIVFEAVRFFQLIPITDFLFGLHWSPQMAIRADQVGSSGAFGAVPLFTGTLLISAIAMVVAAPIGLLSAIYLAEYADRRARSVIKPLLEVLAGVPTVVYGFFAALTVGPILRSVGETIGLNVASESALAAGLIMGVMIIPFVSSLADDMITAVPQSLRDGAYALGATRSETIKQVVLRAALPGIVGG